MLTTSQVFPPQQKITRPELARLMNDLQDQDKEVLGYVLTVGHYALALGMLSTADDDEELDVDTMFEEKSSGVESCGGVLNLTELEELLEAKGDEDTNQPGGIDRQFLLLVWLHEVDGARWAPHEIFGKPVLVTDQLGGSFAYG